MKKQTYIIISAAVVLLALIATIIFFPFSMKKDIVGKTYYCYSHDRVTFFTFNEDDTIKYHYDIPGGESLGFYQSEPDDLTYEVKGKKITIYSTNGIVDIPGKIDKEGKNIHLDFDGGFNLRPVDTTAQDPYSRARVGFVTEAIRKIPYNPSDDKEATTNAERFYKSLSDEEKEDVYNYDELERAIKHFKDVNDMINIINSYRN